MESIVRETLKLIKKGEPVLWAVVAAGSGSSPRSMGSRMLIRKDGSIFGSVGGGRLEGDTLKEASGLFDHPQRKLLHFQLTGKDVADTEMICGGLVDVLLEPLLPQDSTLLPFLEKLQQTLSAEGLLVTSLAPGSPVPFRDCHLLLDEQGAAYGGLAVPLEEVKSHLQAQTSLTLEAREGYPPLLLEPVRTHPLLYIFGGGHISLDLARIARMVDFHVAVMDDRPEFANRDRFPFVDQILLRPFQRAVEGLKLDHNAYVVIVTRGHLHDLDVLRQVIGSQARYIGMIGSRRKRNMIFKRLREEGVPQEKLDQVHSPIGLDIDAETPAEIAVSIVAELIQVRAQGRKRSKTWKV